ncbi:proton-conducting transporter transmembrane domain-containing protein [Thermococcus celericrescens]|uniref:proton-conducting transporter transmembrane domain-containing protein n=1 Tax=Thermococcus celericrescens TaxID=227598 RepID=UPI00247FB1FF|nr:proton-conducting transporter membrane subunit [Thermococcus celericrescens]
MFFGVSMMLVEQDAKRFLAYSTVSQMGYVLLGVGSLNFVGAAYYAMAHSIFKGGLFLAVGSLGRESRKLGGVRLQERARYGSLRPYPQPRDRRNRTTGGGIRKGTALRKPVRPLETRSPLGKHRDTHFLRKTEPPSETG